MTVIARSDQDEPSPPVLTFTSAEALKAMGERDSMIVAPMLPGPSNGVTVGTCDHPDCAGD